MDRRHRRGRRLQHRHGSQVRGVPPGSRGAAPRERRAAQRVSTGVRAPAVTSRRGVLGGAVLLACGAAFLLPPLGIPNAGAYLFIALGLAFAAAWWLGSRQYVYLVPSGVLIGFGLGLVLPALLDLPPEISGPVFLGTLALGLAAVFVLAPQRRLPLAPAAVLGAVALASVLLRI